jgi:hypothetical protein
MALLDEKGITPPPEVSVPPELFGWLKRLQLVLPRCSTYEETLDPTNVVANDESTQTFTVSGLNVNDIVTVNPPALTAGIGIMYARVSAANTLQIRFRNFTGSDIDPASGTWLIKATRK